MPYGRKHSSQVSDWWDYRLFQAWELFPRGGKQKDNAVVMEFAKGSISQWVMRAKERGGRSLWFRVDIWT